MQFRVGSANLNMACEMQSVDARIQFGIEVQMQWAWCMQDKCMDARMRSIRYAKLNMSYY